MHCQQAYKTKNCAFKNQTRTVHLEDDTMDFEAHKHGALARVALPMGAYDLCRSHRAHYRWQKLDGFDLPIGQI